MNDLNLSLSLGFHFHVEYMHFFFFLYKKIEKMWLTSTELGGNALDALENITKKADKDHKKKTHLPKMATSLSRTLRNVSEFSVIKEGRKLLLQGFQFLGTKPFMFVTNEPQRTSAGRL